MDRPRVTVHNMISLDGQMTGFPVNLGLYYQTAARFAQQAVLTGSATLLDALAQEGIDLSGEDPDEPIEGLAIDDARPWLVIVDGRGRLTRLSWLRRQPFWRDVLILCCQTTPAEHLERLRRHHIEHLVVGAEHVDLAAALHQLAERYGVRDVRTDAGGTLNGLLLRAGLVDEISVVIAPYLAGADQVRAVYLVQPVVGCAPCRASLQARELAQIHQQRRRPGCGACTPRPPGPLLRARHLDDADPLASACGALLAAAMGGKVLQHLADGVVEGLQGADQVLLWYGQRLADAVERRGELDHGRLMGGDPVLGQGDQVGAAVSGVPGAAGVASAGHRAHVVRHGGQRHPHDLRQFADGQRPGLEHSAVHRVLVRSQASVGHGLAEQRADPVAHGEQVEQKRHPAMPAQVMCHGVSVPGPSRPAKRGCLGAPSS
jgi:2,5-diamino-6-(ribosylamino)-4(3H)-pyrimidinone 5'-phosphate reductase